MGSFGDVAKVRCSCGVLTEAKSALMGGSPLCASCRDLFAPPTAEEQDPDLEEAMREEAQVSCAREVVPTWAIGGCY